MEAEVKIAKIIQVGRFEFPVWYLIAVPAQGGESYTGQIKVRPEEMEDWRHEYDRRQL